MKKQITTQKIKNSRFFIFAILFLSLSFVVWGQGSETFENANLPSSYSDGNFIGDNAITWNYVHSRDDAGYQITNKGILLRRSSSNSKVYSQSVSGGIGNFTCKLKKGFTGNGNRQVELFINGVSKGTSIAWDNTSVQTFTVSGINVSGNVVIEIRNIKSKQVVVDDISWTGYTPNAADSNVATPSAMYIIPGGNISSIADTPAEAVNVFSFDINDSGNGDTLPTKVTKIRIKPGASNTGDWTQFIQGVVVKDAFTSNIITPTSVSITNNFIDLTFNVGDITAADNDDQVITIAVYLNTSNILDNKVLSFKVDATNHGFTADSSGSTFATTFPNGSVVSNDFTVDVEATEMQFVQQPTDVVVNAIMNPAVVVAYTDENGNRDRDFSGLGVTATLSTNGSAFDPSVTTDGTPVNGAMVFNNIKYIIIDTNVTLTITDTSGLIANQTTTSTAFNVTAPKCNITTGITIGMQDFEITPASPVLPVSLSADVLYSTGDGASPNDPKYVSGSRGVEVNNATGTLTFGPVDTSKFENISFSIRLASFAGTGGNGADSDDTVLIEIFDGTNYSQELKVLGKNNAKWSFISGTGTAQAVYDGDNASVDFQPTSGGNQTTEGYSTLTVNSLPNVSNLEIKITVVNDHNNEFWVFDDAILKGDQKEYTVWDNTTQTWSNGLPNALKKAYLDTDYDTGAYGNIDACACEVANGATVKVGSNEFIKVGNDFINNGQVLVANGGSLVQLNDNVTITGTDFKIERTTTPYRMFDYTYWSSPIENANLNTVFAANPQNRMYWFNTANFNDANNDSFDDENDDWTPASGVMTVGKGYIVMGEGAVFPVPNPIPTTTQTQTVTFTGKINNGTITVPVSLDNSTTDGFINENLIGNPYPSAISAPLFLEQNTNLVGTLYFWTHNYQISSANPGPDAYNFTNDSYVTYTAGTGGTQGNCGGCTPPTDFIASGQGFFADLKQSAGNGTVVFKNNMRVTGNNNNFYRMPNSQTEKNRIWINMTTNTNEFRQILIGFFDDATDNYDNYFDGRRLENGNHFDFYSLINTDKYAVQGVPTLVDEKIIPVGVEVPVDAQLTFSIDRFEGDLNQVNVYLKDNVLNVLHDLKQANYVVDMTQGDFGTRFEIVFSRNALSTNTQTLTTSNDLIVANSNQQMLVKVKNGNMKNIQVYDVVGKLVTQAKVNTNEVYLDTKMTSGAVYFVKVTLENGQVLNKKFIKM